MQLNKRKMEAVLCAPLPVYIYCGTTPHTAEMRLLTLGYLIFVDILQRSSKTGFAVEVILLPTVKKTMYTDIDIFKKKTSTFLFKNDKEGQKEDLNSGKLWRRVRRLWAHQT